MWVGPYFAARLILSSVSRLYGFIRLIALMAIISVPFVLWEAATGSNLFTHLAFNPQESRAWAHPQVRLGHTRAAGAFGHPLALSMFLVSASLFCVALWLHSRDARQRRRWLVAAALTFGAQILTLSRTGRIMAAVGAGLLAFVHFGPGARTRLMTALVLVSVILAGALAVLPAERAVITSIAGSGPGELPPTPATARRWPARRFGRGC